MKSKFYAILFSLVLLLMAFGSATADHLTVPEAALPTGEYWDTYGDQLFSRSGASLPSHLSISGGEFWAYHYSDQLDSQEGASLVSQFSKSSGEYWADYNMGQFSYQEGVSSDSQFSKSSGEYWANLH